MYQQVLLMQMSILRVDPFTNWVRNLFLVRLGNETRFTLTLICVHQTERKSLLANFPAVHYNKKLITKTIKNSYNYNSWRYLRHAIL